MSPKASISYVVIYDMINFKSIKTQLILYLACFALLLALKDKDGAFLLTTFIAVISAVAAEGIVLYFRKKMIQITESAIITGLIVGYVLSSDEAWWKFVLAGFLAIASKYLICFQKKHIFNPAAFGVFLVIISLGVSAQWKATYVWPVVIPFGVYFAYRFKKLEIVLGYAIISLVLFGIQAILSGVPLWNIFGYFSYFYIFVMLIEPKTSPQDPLGKYFFGAGVAALIFLLTELGVGADVEILSLLAMNTAVPLLNKIPFKKGAMG